LEYVPCHDDFNGIGAGFGFPVRFKIEVSNDPDFAEGVTLAVDHTEADVPNPGTSPMSATLPGMSARYVRVTATRLALRQDDYIVALSELKVLDAAGENVAAGREVTALDSIEAPVRWAKRNLTDGLHPENPLSAEELESLRVKRQAIWENRVDEATRTELVSLEQALAGTREQIARLPAPSVIYAGTVHQGTGNFAGTGGIPRPIHVLKRGNVTMPGDAVLPGAVGVRFALPADASEGDRRIALADWLTAPETAAWATCRRTRSCSTGWPPSSWTTDSR
jgi:hypothetical protein